MTTNWGDGPESTIPNYNIHQIGVTVDEKFNDFVTNRDVNEVAIKVAYATPEMHNIGNGEIVVTKDQSKMGGLGFYGNQAPDARTMGRPLVFGQSGNLPHGIPQDVMQSDYWKTLSAEEQAEVKRQQILRYCAPVGISMDSYRRGPGSAKTPLSDGLAVIMHGPATSRLFTGRPLRPMADLVLAMIPSQAQGRAGAVRYQSDGPERYPFTVAEHDPHNPQKWIRRACSSFADRINMANRVNTGNKTGRADATWIFAVATNAHGADSFMLEDDKNASNILAGLLGMVAGVVEILIEDNVLQVKGPAGAPGGVKAWQDTSTTILGLEKQAKGSGAIKLDLVAKICKVVLGNDKQAVAPDNFNYSTAKASALTLLLSGMQDVAATTNRKFAKNIQQVTSGSYARGATGSFDYDLWVDA